MKLRIILPVLLCASVALAQNASDAPDQGQSVAAPTGTFSGVVSAAGFDGGWVRGTTGQLSGHFSGQDAGINNLAATGVASVAGEIASATVVSSPFFDGGTFRGTTAALTTSVATPVVDAGVTVLPTTGKLCLDGPSCTVYVGWGGGNTVQFGNSAANVIATAGMFVTGPSRLRDSISNDTTGANCSSNTGAVCVNDANGLAVANGSGTTVATVSGSTGNIVVSSMAVPVVHNAVTGPALEYGEQVLSGGVATVTFGTAFSGTPTCWCNDTSNTTETTCSTTAESTTQVTLNGTTTGTYSWLCIGPR